MPGLLFRICLGFADSILYKHIDCLSYGIDELTSVSLHFIIWCDLLIFNVISLSRTSGMA